MRDKCFRFGLKSTVLLLRGKPNTHLCKHVPVAEDWRNKYKGGGKKNLQGRKKKKWFLHCNNLQGDILFR